MTPQEYFELFPRSLKEMGFRKNVTHGALGLVSEVGEMCDMLKGHLAYGRPLDYLNLKEETGDVLYFTALICREFNLDFAGCFPSQALVADTIDLNVLDSALYCAHIANNAVFCAQHSLQFSHQSDIRRLIGALVKIGQGAGFTLEEAMERNIAKLAQRYPEKFTESYALNRDLDAERKALENDATQQQ